MTTRTVRQVRDFYNTEQGFVDLMFAMGVGANERDRIVDDGFGAIRDLIKQYDHDVEAFRTYLKTLNRTFGASSNPDRRVYFPPPVMSRMIGVLFYGIISCQSCHMLPDFELLTPEYAMECYKFYESFRNDENSESEKQIDLDIPDFKGASTWRSFRDLVQMRLQLIKGKVGFPIDYVLDTTDRHAQRVNAAQFLIDTVPITEDNFLKTHVVHFGKVFKEDNKRVWNVLKSLLHQTSAYDHIVDCDKTSNGRKAWQILKKFYEGEDFLQRLQDEAFSILSNTIYRGESPRYTFESYVDRHMKAHKLLVDAGYNQDPTTDKVLGMDDSTKIQHFRAGIKLDAGLEQQLSAARTNNKHRSTFADYVSFLQAEVDIKNQRKKELKTNNSSKRAVAKVEHGKNSNKGKKSRSRFVDGKRVESKKYPRNEWMALTQNQKDAVMEMYLESKGKSPQSKRNKNNVDIKSLQSAMKQDLIDVGDAIVNKIVHFEEEEEKSDTEEQSDSKSSKRKVKSGGVGNFLSKRGKRN